MRLRWRLLKECGEPVQLVIPEPALALEPANGFDDGRRHESALALAPDELPLHQPRALEHAQVLRHGRQRHVERRGQGARGLDTLGQTRQDLPACGVGQRAEHGVELR